MNQLEAIQGAVHARALTIIRETPLPNELVDLATMPTLPVRRGHAAITTLTGAITVGKAAI